jgi:hypothetical protein
MTATDPSPKRDEAAAATRSMRRAARLQPALALVLCLLAAALLSLVPTWSPAARADTIGIADAQDAAAGADIATAEAGHTRSGLLRYRVTTYLPFRRLEAPCVYVRSGLRRDDYLVCGDGDVVRLADEAVSGVAKVTRPSHTSVTYVVRPEAIGSPSFHRWRIVDFDDACGEAVCDGSPDKGYVTHQRWVSYQQWAKKLLHELQVPRCTENKIVVVAWEANEGTQAVWNPLATTYDMPGDTEYNSVGVRNYASLAQGLDATRLTIERGFTLYGYGEIVQRLERCAPPLKTARAIKRSSWCRGCSDGRYVTGLIRPVKADYEGYAARLISTAL